MLPNPYGYDEDSEKFKREPSRSRWWLTPIAAVLIIVLIVPMAFGSANVTRDLYILGFILCVIIFALYRIIFSQLFGERAARREFSLPHPPKRRPTAYPVDARPRKRERIRTTDGTWLEVVDEDQTPP